MNLISFYKSSLNSLFRGLLSLIYKENCCICGCSKDDSILCKTCAKDVQMLSAFLHSKISGVEIYSVFIYKNIVRTLIHKLKFDHKKAVARVFALFLFDFFNKILENTEQSKINKINLQNTVIVPIPTNKKNIQKRGYNNVYEIASEFAKIANLKLCPDLLTKIRDTKPQFKLNKEARKSNVEGCFQVNKKIYNNETIILIDDIITTGSTIYEAIGAFQKEDINNIICITISKAV